MKKVWVFFYGTFVSAHVLRQYGINCDTTYPAKISGYSLSIRPRVNLTLNTEAYSFGGVALISHDNIATLYGDLEKQFGIVYQPYPIITELLDGSMRAALCFISHNIPNANPDPGYIEEMVKCATEMKAPPSYISHIKSFVMTDG